jgi:hypothetical protein
MHSPPQNECYSPTLKRCQTCKKDLPRSDYHANKSTRDGLHGACRECRRKEYDPTYVPLTSREPSKRPRKRHISMHHGSRRLRLIGYHAARNRIGGPTVLGRHIAEYLMCSYYTQTEIAWRVDVSRNVVRDLWRSMRRAFPGLRRFTYQNHVHERENGGVHLRHRNRRKMTLLLPPCDPRHAEIYAWLRGGCTKQS